MERARSVAEKRLRVLLVGHACGVGLGSEPGLTWNWAWHLAERHEVWVITHPQHRAAIEAAIEREGDRAPRMVWVDLPKRWDPWEPTRGERGIHLHYVFWQRAAFARARQLHASRPFDIVHHVSWATVNSAPELWRLGPPFVWGPLGGGQAAPLRFGRYLGARGFVKEVGRTVRRRLMPLAPSLRRAAANSAFILATNRETADILRRAGAPRVEPFYDNGVVPEQFVTRRRERAIGGPVQLVWAGRLEARKGLPLALEALARVGDPTVRLSIAGDGPQITACQRRAHALGLGERVRFLGKLPRERLMHDLYAASDALLFTSLQDSSGSVALEAMAAGLAVIGLNHQGVATIIPKEAGIMVAVDSPAATIQSLADAIRSLAGSPDSWRRRGEEARRHAATEEWRHRAARMSDLYSRCLGSPISLRIGTSRHVSDPLGSFPMKGLTAGDRL
jgi:glycosyltransferase involved in cell wall biosynthesis